MSVLQRPDGDAIAASFGKYMTRSEVLNVNTRDKFDVLCVGGIHFVAKIVEIDKKGHGRLHFCKWNEKYDHIGDLTALYIAAEGCYSTGTLNAHNQYIDPNEVANTNSRRSSRDGTKEDKYGVTYAEKSRYDADFLARPYRNDRKRRSLDTSTSTAAAIDTTTREASKAVHIVSAHSSEHGLGEATENVAKKLKNEPPSAALVVVDELASTSAAMPVPAMVTADDAVVSSVAEDSVAGTSTGAGAGAGTSTAVQHPPQLQLQHRLLPSFAMDVVVSDNNNASSNSDQVAGDVGDAGANVATQHTHNQPPVPGHCNVPLIHALSGPSTLGGKTMACWKEYYRRLLRSSDLQEYKDTAAAMDWLDKHLDACKARGQISGKVRGPVGLICMAIDTPSAIMLEHSIGQQHLLAFVVDRMQDQTYLENALIHTQKLCVKVLYSGTKTRFSGYKRLLDKVAYPVPGAELSNLADRMYCPQLIRNCLHSSGCTAEFKIGGFCTQKDEVVRHLDSAFSTKESLPSVYLYEVRDIAGGPQLSTQDTTQNSAVPVVNTVDAVTHSAFSSAAVSSNMPDISVYHCADASVHTDKHYSVSKFDCTTVPVLDPAHRLLYSGDEQLKLADTVPYSSIVAVLPAVVPVSSSKSVLTSSHTVSSGGVSRSNGHHTNTSSVQVSAARTAQTSSVSHPYGSCGGNMYAGLSTHATIHGDISRNHHDLYANGALHAALSTTLSASAATTTTASASAPTHQVHQVHIQPSKYTTLKAAGMVVNSVGTAAVWNVLTQEPGLWFRDRNALQLDLVSNYQYEPIPEPCSRDKDWGYFVPLKHFIFTPEGGRICPVFLHFRNTEPLLVLPTGFPDGATDGTAEGADRVNAVDAPTVFPAEAEGTEVRGAVTEMQVAGPPTAGPPTSERPTTEPRAPTEVPVPAPAATAPQASAAMSTMAFDALRVLAQASSSAAPTLPASPPASPVSSPPSQATQIAAEDVRTVTPKEGQDSISAGNSAEVPVAGHGALLDDSGLQGDGDESSAMVVVDSVEQAVASAEVQQPADGGSRDVQQDAAAAEVGGAGGGEMDVVDPEDTAQNTVAGASNGVVVRGSEREGGREGDTSKGDAAAAAGESCDDDLEADADGGEDDEDLRSTSSEDEGQKDHVSADSRDIAPASPTASAAQDAIGHPSRLDADHERQAVVAPSQELSGSVDQGPVLGLHTKPALFGLVFASKEVFQRWHLAQWPNAQPNILPEIPPRKVAFVTLASMRMDRDYYDLKLLKLKRLHVFSSTSPVCSADSKVARELARKLDGGSLLLSSDRLLPLSPMPAPLPLSLLSVFDGDVMSVVFNMNAAASSSAHHANTGVDVAPSHPPHPAPLTGPPTGPLQQTTADWKVLRTQLNMPAIITNLQRGIDSTHLYAAEMRRRNINPLAFQALLRAQIKLAEATKLMLG